MKEEIIAACVITDRGLPVLWKRHWDAIFLAVQVYGSKPPIKINKQGFRTNKGRFVDRFEGMKLAKENWQLIKLSRSWKPIDYSRQEELFSEDLR